LCTVANSNYGTQCSFTSVLTPSVRVIGLRKAIKGLLQPGKRTFFYLLHPPSLLRLMLPKTFSSLSLLSLPALWFSLSARAGEAPWGASCSQANNRLQVGTYQFYSECDNQTYCAANSTCAWRGCRSDDFPFGYDQDSHSIPPKCPREQFCPDEMDQCQNLIPPGGACQLNRDGSSVLLVVFCKNEY